MNSDDVRNLANLARIDIDDQEIDGYKHDFDSILGYVDSIQGVEVSDSEPEYFNKNELRDDEKIDETGSNSEKLLNEAPDKKDGFYKVQKIL